MTKRAVVLGLLFASLAIGACTRGTTGPADEDWQDRSDFRSGLIDAAVLEEMPGATVYHIDLEIPADFDLLTGHETVHYTNREDEALDEVYFQLFPNTAGGATNITSVQVDGGVVEPASAHLNSAVRVPLPTALPVGEDVVIEVDFTVEVAREMAGNYGLFGYFDGFLVLDAFYPVIPVYDNEAWNVQDPPPVGDVTHFDASFYLVTVTAPADLTVITSGELIERELAGANQVLTVAAGPARDFYLAAATDLITLTEQVGATTVNSYAPPGFREGAELALQTAAAALESFGARIGPYPYREFDVLSTPMQALGIEYPGMTNLALDLYDPQAEVLGLPAHVILESTVAHEVAHQWFYNVVGNDQVDEPWLDEAIAQYLTGVYYRDSYGEAAEQSFRGSWDARWDSIERAEVPIGLASAAFEADEYSPIIYGRGPIFVARLEDEMGREALAAFFRDYYSSNQWRVATGEGFRELAEHHCECDLSPLFAQWVDAPE